MNTAPSFLRGTVRFELSDDVPKTVKSVSVFYNRLMYSSLGVLVILHAISVGQLQSVSLRRQTLE